MIQEQKILHLRKKLSSIKALKSTPFNQRRQLAIVKMIEELRITSIKKRNV